MVDLLQKNFILSSEERSRLIVGTSSYIWDSYSFNNLYLYVCRPYTNKYYKHNARGKYLCKVCAVEIFCSTTKYDSGSGWPSFYDVISKDRVFFRQDASGSESKSCL